MNSSLYWNSVENMGLNYGNVEDPDRSWDPTPDSPTHHDDDPTQNSSYARLQTQEDAQISPAEVESRQRQFNFHCIHGRIHL